MNSPKQLRHALSHLDGLPAIPSIAQRILALRINTDEGERALLDLIGKDPAILSRIIGLANSPLFGMGREILTLKDAGALLGSKRIKMVALSFAMMTSMARKPPGPFNIQGLWQHSMAIAMTMDALARLMPARRRPSDDEIYLSGLLHDIGFLVLDYLDPALSDRFHARMASEPGCPVEEIEAEMLEMDHSELGAALGRHWNLPEPIVAVINYHHTPNDERAEAGKPLVAMASLAEKLLPPFGIAESVQMRIGADEWRALGIDPALEGEVIAAVAKNVREVSALF